MSGLTKPREVLCQHCYRTTMRRVCGGGADAGRFCSRKCAAQHRSHVAQEVAGIRRLASAPQPKPDRKRGLRALVRLLRRLLAERSRKLARESLAASLQCREGCDRARPTAAGGLTMTPEGGIETLATFAF